MKKIRTIGVYWHNRPATLRECTLALQDFLPKLKEHNPQCFPRWCEMPDTEVGVPHCREVNTYEELKRTFFHATDDEDAYPEFFYDITLWNRVQDPYEEVRLKLSLGGILGKDTRQISPNCCYITIPKRGKIRDFYNEPAHQTHLESFLKRCWNADFTELFFEEEAVNVT